MAPFLCCRLLLIFFFSFASACDRCVHQTKVAYFSKSAALLTGSCGYGSLAVGFNGEHLAAAVPTHYNNGAGCGSCFQIRCKDATLCTKAGVTVVVTDGHKSNESDFVLSSRAFRAMANKGKDIQLLNRGVVDVEYKRVPCFYKNKNLTVLVDQSSKKPYYLAIKILYQGGQTEILTVEVAQPGSSIWSSLSRNYGAVWDTSRFPSGPLHFKFAVKSGFDHAFYWTETVLPADWKNGVLYDTGVQIKDIEQEMCSPCDKGIWKP